jgi:hypothetical protein
MAALTCCVALGVRGPAWLKVILDHRRQMYQIKLKEKKNKESLNRKLEEKESLNRKSEKGVAKQAGNPTQNPKPKGSS